MTDAVFDQEWERVKLTVTYYTGSATRRTSHEISRTDLEREHRQALVDRFAGMELSEEEQAELEENIASFELSNEQFMDQVFRAASELATSPIQIAGPAANNVRVLPPWAIRSVDIDVLDPAPSGLVLPN